MVLSEKISNILYFSDRENLKCIQADFNNMREQSIEDNLTCIRCNGKNNFNKIYTLKDEKSTSKLIVIALDFIFIKKKIKGKEITKIEIPKGYVINTFIKDPFTNDIYDLIALINMPSLSHFNAYVNDIYYNGDERKGWWFHDGMKNMGFCKIDNNIKDFDKYNPY